MPTYEFRCRKCGAAFSVRERISEFARSQHACPSCKSADVEQRMSEFYARTPRKS